MIMKLNKLNNNFMAKIYKEMMKMSI